MEENELALLTGEIGCGKTTISRALVDRVGDSRPVILLINPRLTPAQLLRAIASGLELPADRTRAALLDRIHERLYELHEQDRHPLLIIDEAQLIPGRAAFDEIRLMTNFQLDDQNLMSVVLIGQPELDDRLDRPQYEALRQRIGIRFRLHALEPDETAKYVDHRIRVAGGSRNPFEAEALDLLHRLTGGVPRLINAVATTALLDAFGDDATNIDRARIRSSAAEHRLGAKEDR
ncbi:MAG: AAA family ATPase [Acidobacteriota bacterium]